MAIFSMTRQCQKKKFQITLANINKTPCLLPRICLQAQQKSILLPGGRYAALYKALTTGTYFFHLLFLQQTFMGRETSLRAWTTWTLECMKSCHVMY